MSAPESPKPLRCPLCSPLTPKEGAAWVAGTWAPWPMAPCEKPEHAGALLPPEIPRMPMSAPSGAPEPIVTVDGPESEYFFQTRRVRTTLRCPACGHVAGFEGRHVPTSGLPPELRDVAAWQQEARAREAAGRLAHSEVMARRAYAAHDCGAGSNA